MRVLVLVKGTPRSEGEELPSDELEALLAAMGAYNEQLAEAGVLLGGEGLHPSSRGTRVRFAAGTTTVIDGPFVPATELVAGFWIWQVASMDEAIAWARRCPHPMPGEEAVLELRPIMEADDFGDEMTPELRTQEERLRSKLEDAG
jgi:hypothetical protein